MWNPHFAHFFRRKTNRKTPNKSRKTFHPFPHRGSRRPGLLQIFHEANWQLILQRALATRGGAATATGPDGSGPTPLGWSASKKTSAVRPRLGRGGWGRFWCEVLTSPNVCFINFLGVWRMIEGKDYNETLMIMFWDSKGISIRCQWDFNSSTDFNGTKISTKIIKNAWQHICNPQWPC